ncbi:hypothetical protein ABFW09_04995, partial [Mycolicibacterium fortuitum]
FLCPRAPRGPASCSPRPPPLRISATPRPDLNPEGPTTLTAIADTGSGSIMTTIFGQVTTTEMQCQFMPTIGSTVVP